MIGKKLKAITRKLFPVTKDEVEGFILQGNAGYKRNFVEDLLDKFLTKLMCNSEQSITLPTGGPVIKKNGRSLSWHRQEITLSSNGSFFEYTLVPASLLVDDIQLAIKSQKGVLSIGNYVLHRDLSDDDMEKAASGLRDTIMSIMSSSVDDFLKSSNYDGE